MLDQQVTLLRQFIEICKQNPAILHEPKLSFYKDYLERQRFLFIKCANLSLGAKIPPAPHAEPKEKVKTPEPETKAPPAEPVVEEEDLPPLELDESSVIQGEEDEALPMGDIEKEVSDADLEKAEEYRDAAMNAFSEGILNLKTYILIFRRFQIGRRQLHASYHSQSR